MNSNEAKDPDQPDSGDSAELDRPQRTDHSEDQADPVPAKMATFVPELLRGKAPAVREAVLSAIRPWATDVQPKDEHEVRRFMRPAAAIVLHAMENYGSLDPESLLHPDCIERFVNHDCESESNEWKDSTRWLLDRISQRVVPHLWPMERAKLGKHRVAAPYPLGEEEGGPSRIRGIEGCWHRLGSLCHEDAAGFEVAWVGESVGASS